METMGIAYLATRARWPRYFICLVFNSEWGKGLWGPLLYRDYYRDPIPHSLLSTRESWCREGPSRPFVLFGVGVRWFSGSQRNFEYDTYRPKVQRCSRCRAPVT